MTSAKAERKVIALAGNPNVGKSTIFNGLTNMKQHTGNWPGKTVSNARGYYRTERAEYELVDVPGTYSLAARSEEEQIAGEFLRSGEADAVIVVCDATCLERNLNLVLQIMQISGKVVVCLNLMDEAERKGISIHAEELSEKLGTPVVSTIARDKKNLEQLMDVTEMLIFTECQVEQGAWKGETAEMFVKRAEEICKGIVTYDNPNCHEKDRRIDRILTSKRTGYPIMLALLAAILWITIVGANYPSSLLADVLFRVQEKLTEFFMVLHAPEWLHDLLILGVYRVLAWVVSVMLPPMAIFFPLFTLLEDVGYLPRIAYNLDKPFQCCRACGKQSLTMCMGFGCNAVGVMGCRIIDSPRERMIAILTNSFVPCNGRFPILITLIAMFFVGSETGGFSTVISALMLTGLLVLGILITLLVSAALSATVLKGMPSSFTLELPPYRMPQVGKVIVRSIFDRTIFVLGRAVKAAIPAGFLIWLLANMYIGNDNILSYCTGFLDPFAKLIGLDGVILMAFILGLPANEIVMPIIIMAYMGQGSLAELGSLDGMRRLFLENGWTQVTALCVMLFSLMHWPCATTLLTIKKETGSLKWTMAAVLIPTVTGVILCFLCRQLLSLLL